MLMLGIPNNLILTNYYANGGYFQPSNLPTVLFKITSSGSPYSNYQMMANDRLTIDIFDQPISYGYTGTPDSSVTITFPENIKPINIRQWVNLVDDLFSNADLSNLLSLDWTFFPYHVQNLNQSVIYLKSVAMLTTNSSSYTIRLTGNWQLLQFFGKPISAMPGMSMPGMGLQQIYPMYASQDPNNPIMAPDGIAQLIINPKQKYIGLVDGFENDNLMNIAVKKGSTEKWIYHNCDTQDTHPLHFHLTSGFVDPRDPRNSSCLFNKETIQLYSKDVYSIGSQQTIVFYLKFINYSSENGGGLSPPIKYLGYMYHCHYMAHHDMNMMGEYFVYKNYNDYF